MPTPDDDEDESDFMERCVMQLLDDGEAVDREEAVTMCEDMWAERSLPAKTERRSAQLEIRANGRKLSGLAAVFNTEARIGPFIETIAPGAFQRSLSSDIVALVDHDVGRLLGRTRSGSLRLAENSKGLIFDIDLPNTSYADDLRALVERGDAGGMSFGFTVGKDGESWNGNKRTLTNIDLKEISVVSAWPAYEGTSVSARSRRRLPRFPRVSVRRRYLDIIR